MDHKEHYLYGTLMALAQDQNDAIKKLTTGTLGFLGKSRIQNRGREIGKFVTKISNHKNKQGIQNIYESIQEDLKHKKWEHLLFSYHGIPERHIRKSDITKSHCKIDKSCCQTTSEAHRYCYRHQCYETTRQVAEYLELKEGTYSTSFQSRLGVDPWLQPYTDQTIARFAKKGVKNMAIVTPAFVSDCLETLEEIGMEAAEDFEEKGGEELHVIPCINTRADWVNVMSRWIDQWAKAETVTSA